MAAKFSMQRMRSSLEKYGRTGVLVYLGISGCVTTGLYVAIEQNVDVKGLIGIKEDPDSEPTLVERLLVGKGSHIALAIVCSKAFVPIKLPLAVALTPYVHRWAEKLRRGLAHLPK